MKLAYIDTNHAQQRLRGTSMNHQELRTHVRRERAQLIDELRPLQRRIAEITARLEELDKADDLLAGSTR